MEFRIIFYDSEFQLLSYEYFDCVLTPVLRTSPHPPSRDSTNKTGLFWSRFTSESCINSIRFCFFPLYLALMTAIIPSPYILYIIISTSSCCFVALLSGAAKAPALRFTAETFYLIVITVDRKEEQIREQDGHEKNGATPVLQGSQGSSMPLDQFKRYLCYEDWQPKTIEEGNTGVQSGYLR